MRHVRGCKTLSARVTHIFCLWWGVWLWCDPHLLTAVKPRPLKGTSRQGRTWRVLANPINGLLRVFPDELHLRQSRLHFHHHSISVGLMPTDISTSGRRFSLVPSPFTERTGSLSAPKFSALPTPRAMMTSPAVSTSVVVHPNSDRRLAIHDSFTQMSRS